MSGGAIGGDQQRIQRMNTQHSDTTFKHVLLPLWTAAFQFRDKSYRFVVNGRTGKIRGERPYSVVKIALAAGLVLAMAAGALAFATRSGMFANTGPARWSIDVFEQWQSPSPPQWPESLPQREQYRF